MLLLIIEMMMMMMMMMMIIISFLFLAPTLANWSVSIDKTTTESIRFAWQNLQTLVDQQISYYFVVIKNSHGISVDRYIVPGNTASHEFPRLSPYTEYRLQ